MKKAIFVTVIAVILICFCFAGCASEYSYEDGYVNEEPITEEAVTEDVMEEEVMEEESSASGIGSVSDVLIADDDARKLQYNLFLSIDTDEFDSDYNKLITNAEKYGGYVESESLSGSAVNEFSRQGRYLTMTLRIPVKNYKNFANALSDVGVINTKETQTQDLTENYYDLDSRIELLEERKERLMGHLDSAVKMDDIIMLEDEIADVIYELESLEKNKRGIEKKTSYATVDISMTEYVKSEDIKDSESLTDAGEAFNMTMKGMGEFFEVFGLGLAAAAPVLILIAVIVVGTLFAIKGIKILIKKAKNTKKQP